MKLPIKDLEKLSIINKVALKSKLTLKDIAEVNEKIKRKIHSNILSI